MRYLDVVGGYLRHLKTLAERQAGQALSRVVLGRPVFFVDDDAELHLLPRCGHMLTWEQAQPVTDLLLDWLARMPDGPPGPAPSPTAP